MSARNAHPNQLQPQSNHTDEDVKASYDDLIDEYSTPYTANTRHQTFAVGTPIHQQYATHHRGSSNPLSSKTFDTKQSDDTHETASYIYPPAVSSKEVDNRTIWQKVGMEVQI